MVTCRMQPSPAWTNPRPRSGPRSAPRPWPTRAASPTGSSTCCARCQRHHRRLRHRSAHALPADGNPRREGGSRRRGVVASLCHDIGKAVSVPNHPRHRGGDAPAVRAPTTCTMIRTCTRTSRASTTTRTSAATRRAGAVPWTQPFYDLTAQFADEWDQIAFDPDVRHLPARALRAAGAARSSPLPATPERSTAAAQTEGSSLRERSASSGGR